MWISWLCLERARKVSRVVTLVFGAAVFGPASAQVPAGASPGGALPRIEQPAGRDLTPPPAAFPIPPAVERPLAEDEGQRLFVKRFHLEGVTDRPQTGIDAKELEALVEELRVQRQGLDQVDESGFTAEERGEIATFMRAVINNPDLDYHAPEYEALVDRLRALKAERDAGMTLGQMQQIANTVTEYYRSAGYVLAQAYIPAQEVDDGAVRIAVLEGTLGNVLVEGNKAYSSDVLVSPFRELIDAPVTADGVESAILTASDYPGLSVFGVFRPGREVGTTDLVLRVQDERPWDISVRADNHGSRFTGKNRGILESSLNNPTGAGDRLSATVVRQVNPANSNFGELRYERPAWTPGLLFGASWSRNPFKVGAELQPAQITGESTTAELYADRSLIRSRGTNVYGRVGWRRTEELTSVAKTPIGEDQLSYLFGELRFDSIEPDAQAINAATLGFAYGLGDHFGGNSRDTAQHQAVRPRRTGASGKPAANDFWRLDASLTRFQKITDGVTMLARVEGQFSNSTLTSTNQFAIGGPANVRAYNVSEFLVDRALFASMEWSIDAPLFADAQFREGMTWGQVLKVSFFADYAWGQLNDATPTDIETLSVGGVGAALSFNLPGQFLGRLQYAYPIGGQVPGDPGDRDSGKWWLDLTYQF